MLPIFPQEIWARLIARAFIRPTVFPATRSMVQGTGPISATAHLRVLPPVSERPFRAPGSDRGKRKAAGPEGERLLAIKAGRLQ